MSIRAFMLKLRGYLIFFWIFLPKMSKRLTVSIRMRGAWFMLRLLVAFCFDLQVGQKYLLSFYSRSVEQNFLRHSPRVCSFAEPGSGKLNVNCSSKVSLL